MDDQHDDSADYIFHISWLEVAIKNFKEQNNTTKTVKGNETMVGFIKKWAKEELNNLHKF